MRQEVINIYTIKNHPNKDVCFEWIRNNWHDLGEFAIQDMVASLEALEQAIGGKLDYSFGIVPDRGEFIKMTGYNLDKLVKLYEERGDLPLTGVCYDYEVISGLYEGNLEKQVLETMHDQGEYLYSDQGLRELCEANEYEFLECGKVV